jgi:hypothetical protein
MHVILFHTGHIMQHFINNQVDTVGTYALIFLYHLCSNSLLDSWRITVSLTKEIEWMHFYRQLSPD